MNNLNNNLIQNIQINTNLKLNSTLMPSNDNLCLSNMTRKTDIKSLKSTKKEFLNKHSELLKEYFNIELKNKQLYKYDLLSINKLTVESHLKTQSCLNDMTYKRPKSSFVYSINNKNIINKKAKKSFNNDIYRISSTQSRSNKQ